MEAVLTRLKSYRDSASGTVYPHGGFLWMSSIFTVPGMMVWIANKVDYMYIISLLVSWDWAPIKGQHRPVDTSF